MNHTEYLEAKKHFKPHSKAAKVRQHIWAVIGAEPSKKFTVNLVRNRLKSLGIELKDGEIYSAMKKLCTSGLARRVGSQGCLGNSCSNKERPRSQEGNHRRTIGKRLDRECAQEVVI